MSLETAEGNIGMESEPGDDKEPNARPIVVLYHSDADGFGAAYAAWENFGDVAVYIPVNYGEPVPPVPDHSRVYILDFSYEADDLLLLAERCELVQVIDHHKTAQAQLAGLDGMAGGRLKIQFDLTHSGAVLTWRFFFPNAPEPALLCYIEDRDLWKFALQGSREVNAGIALEPWDFEAWHRITHRLLPLDNLFERGVVALEVVEKTAKRAAGHVQTATLDGHLAAVINCTAFISETCHAILKRYPQVEIAAAWFDNDRGKRVWSLRSRADGPDVGAIAQKRGGGGHPQAAGYEQRIGPAFE